jgi:CDP-4-dehydro-6-deoxyglucose reductase
MLSQLLTETHFYQVISLIEWQGDVVQVLLQPTTSAPLKYQAGQYIQLAYPSGNWLPLSIANAPRADHIIELHIRHRVEDIETRELLLKLKINALVNLAGPFGHAVYRPQPDLPIILLAGGTGIAPLKALLEQATTLQDTRQWHLYWSVRAIKDFYLPPWQSQLTVTETRLISQPSLDKIENMQVGYVHKVVIQDYPDLSGYQVYASGPVGMVLAAHQLLSVHGLPAGRFYSDMI